MCFVNPVPEARERECSASPDGDSLQSSSPIELVPLQRMPVATQAVTIPSTNRDSDMTEMSCVRRIALEPNDDGGSIPWVNDNWRLVSRIMNTCHMSDPEGEVFLSTLRMIDFTKSIPPNVRAIRKFEAAHVGHTM